MGRERKVEVQKIAGLANRVRDLEKAECEVIQSTGHLDIAAHTHLDVTSGSQKLPTETLLATLTQLLPRQTHLTQAHSSVTDRNMDVTHIILI